MLKQCALAFAQSKPTEWDYFRQEWLVKVMGPVIDLKFVPLLTDLSTTVLTTGESKEEPKPKVEPPTHTEAEKQTVRRRNLNREETE